MLNHILNVCLFLCPLILFAQIPNLILIEPDDKVICSTSDCIVQHMDFTGTTQSDYIPEGQPLDWLVLLDINNDWVYEKAIGSKEEDWSAKYGYPIDFTKREKIKSGQSFRVSFNEFRFLTPVLGSQHRMVWKVIDTNTNNIQRTSYFTVEDCEGPKVICKDTISVISHNPHIVDELRAVDLIHTMADNCTVTEDLRYTFTEIDPKLDASFDRHTLTSSIKITEFELLNCSYPNYYFNAPVYVWDEYGNMSSCETVIKLKNSFIYIADLYLFPYGTITNVNGEGIENVDVVICYNGEPPFITITNADGKYETENNYYARSALVTPGLDRNYLEGVSMHDIIRIKKHIAGGVKFDHPFQYIAADVNLDGNVDELDIKEINALISGEEHAFSGGKSWRFIFMGPDFDMNNFDVVESAEVDICNFPITSDFIGIKLGDVNFSIEKRRQ